MNQQQKMNDIIFKNRNKVYGAYMLRTEYSITLLKSLFATMAFALGIAFICFLLSKKVLPSQSQPILLPPEQTQVHTTPVDLKPKQPEQSRETPASRRQKKSELAAIIIRDSLVFKKDTAHIFAEEKQQKNIIQGLLGEGNLGEKGNGKTETTSTGTKSDTLVALVADEYPEFEGGLAALNRWIASRLRYPSEAIEYAKQGKVHVKFIVDEQGKVLFPAAMNKLGFGLEEEALRVVSGIPNFKSPAKINGKPVKCYFVLPINFKLY